MTTEKPATSRHTDPWTGEPLPDLDQPRNPDGHVCVDEVVEEATSPDHTGTFTVTERCAICRKVVGTHTDTV